MSKRKLLLRSSEMNLGSKDTRFLNFSVSGMLVWVDEDGRQTPATIEEFGDISEALLLGNITIQPFGSPKYIRGALEKGEVGISEF